MNRLAIVTAVACLLCVGCASQHRERNDAADMHYKMYLVYRIWSDDLMARVSGVTPEEQRAHNLHIEGYSQTAVSTNLHDENGKAIGVVALNAFDTREGVEYYVYEDPYTKAGFYKEIRIIPVEVDFIDSYFRIEPAWIRGEGLAIKHRRYERDGLAPVPDTAVRAPR